MLLFILVSFVVGYAVVLCDRYAAIRVYPRLTDAWAARTTKRRKAKIASLKEDLEEWIAIYNDKTARTMRMVYYLSLAGKFGLIALIYFVAANCVLLFTIMTDQISSADLRSHSTLHVIRAIFVLAAPYLALLPFFWNVRAAGQYQTRIEALRYPGSEMRKLAKRLHDLDPSAVPPPPSDEPQPEPRLSQPISSQAD